MNGKEMCNFCHKKLFFVNFFQLNLDLDFKFLKPFGLWLDFDEVLKIQDEIWIAKYMTVRSSLVHRHYFSQCL